MIGQRGADAESQRLDGHGLGFVKNNCSISLERKLVRKERPESLDQGGPAVEVDRVLGGIGFFPADPYGTSAFAHRGHISGFAPFERFFNVADPRSRRGGL